MYAHACTSARCGDLKRSKYRDTVGDNKEILKRNRRTSAFFRFRLCEAFLAYGKRVLCSFCIRGAPRRPRSQRRALVDTRRAEPLLDVKCPLQSVLGLNKLVQSVRCAPVTQTDGTGATTATAASPTAPQSMRAVQMRLMLGSSCPQTH